MKNRLLAYLVCFSFVGLLLDSCAVVKQSAQKQQSVTAAQQPPCNFQAGRLHLDWESIYDQTQLKLPVKNGQDSLPAHFIAFRINVPALNSYLSNLNGLPYEKRVISVPINKGNSCLVFHLEPSGTMSEGLQKKFPNIKSWKGFTPEDAHNEIRMDFNGKTMKAAVTHGKEIELLTPWKDENGVLYYLLYNKKDAVSLRQPFKSY